MAQPIPVTDPGALQIVDDPAQLYPHPPTLSLSKIGAAAKRNLPAIALQGVGQAGGEAGAALLLSSLGLAPETGGLSLLPLLVGAVGAGAANVAAKDLPKSYGGNPSESNRKAFAWGALPALAGAGIARAVGKRLGSAAASGTEKASADFEKQGAAEAERQRKILTEGVAGESPTEGSVKRLGHLLGSRTGMAPTEPLIGETRTAATDEAINDVLGPINRMRQVKGAPLGQAYRALKGGELTPEEEQSLADASRSVREDSISPAPKAAGIFNRLKRLGAAPEESGTGPMRVAESGTGMDTLSRQLQRGRVPALSSATPGQIEKLRVLTEARHVPTREDYIRILGEFGGEAKPLSYDDARELRQYVNQRLRTATGGDVHALLGLQGALDSILSEHLPENMSKLRTSYRGFIKNYDWRDINKLRAAGTPGQVADWLFTQDPSVQNEIIENAKPAERETYRTLFARRVLSKANPDALPADQEKVIRKELSPYVQNGTLTKLYGPQRADAIRRDFIRLPVRRAAAAANLNSQKGQQLFVNGFMDAARKSGKADLQAAATGYDAWLKSLPSEQQAVVKKFAQPLTNPAEVPRLPGTAETLAAHLKQHGTIYFPRFIAMYGLGALPLAMMGGAVGGSFMGRYALGFGLMTAGTVGYRAAMDTFGADVVAKMYASPVGRAAGVAAFKALAIAGGRALHQATQSQSTSQPLPPNTPVDISGIR